MCSPESRLGIDPWMVFCFCLARPSDAAHETVSQYIILPVSGVMIINPGSPAVTLDSRIPRGTGPFGSLQGSGMEIVNTSAGEGEEVAIEYGQIIAWEFVMARA